MSWKGSISSAVYNAIHKLWRKEQGTGGLREASWGMVSWSVIRSGDWLHTGRGRKFIEVRRGSRGITMQKGRKPDLEEVIP